MRRFWRAETGIFLALWLLLLVSGRSRLFRDPGTFWHTVVGEEILTSGQFTNTDHFSFRFAGQPWIPHQWLGECIMALVHRLDGLDSLLLMTATLLAALYTWAASRLLRAGLHWSLTAVLIVLAVAASTSHFHVRPHLGTIVFLGCTFAVLCDFESGRTTVRRMFWLVPIYVLWTNIHGGLLGGLATMTMAVSWWTLSWLLRRESPVRNGRQVLGLALLLAACGLTALVNPYGLALPRTWLGIMDSPILPEIIIEHSPLRLTQPEGVLVLLFAAVYVFALVGVGRRWPRATWLLPFVWFYLTYSRVRHAPLFAIAAVLALAEILPYTRWAVWLAKPGRELFRAATWEIKVAARRWEWRPALLPIVVVLLAIVLQVREVRTPVIGHGWARLDPSYWPVELLPDLQELAASVPDGTPIFNEYLYGGFLIYHTPKLRVFVDDRCELYGDKWLFDFVHGEWQDTHPEMDSDALQFALTRTGSGFDHYFRHQFIVARRTGARFPRWMVVRQTETATLYRRVTYYFGSNPCQ